MQERDSLIVAGFQFGTQKDAEVAENEKDKVILLESRMDYDSPEQVFTVYEKAIENRVFQTPVGYVYLKKLQEFLHDHPLEDKKIKAIPLYLRYSNIVRDKTEPAKARIKPGKQPKGIPVSGLGVSIFFNIILTVMLIAMFAIALMSETPNMVNYRYAIENRYAKWEEELTEREAAVRDREKELNLKE